MIQINKLFMELQKQHPLPNSETHFWILSNETLMSVIVESYQFPKQLGYDPLSRLIWGLPYKVVDCEGFELKEIIR